MIIVYRNLCLNKNFIRKPSNSEKLEYLNINTIGDSNKCDFIPVSVVCEIPYMHMSDFPKRHADDVLASKGLRYELPNVCSLGNASVMSKNKEISKRGKENFEKYILDNSYFYIKPYTSTYYRITTRTDVKSIENEFKNSDLRAVTLCNNKFLIGDYSILKENLETLLCLTVKKDMLSYLKCTMIRNNYKNNNCLVLLVNKHIGNIINIPIINRFIDDLILQAELENIEIRYVENIDSLIYLQPNIPKFTKLQHFQKWKSEMVKDILLEFKSKKFSDEEEESIDENVSEEELNPAQVIERYANELTEEEANSLREIAQAAAHTAELSIIPGSVEDDIRSESNQNQRH